MAKRKSSVDEILIDPPQVIEETEKSPVDNLPVATGKRRRGRPRKARVVEAAQEAVSASDAASPAGADVGQVVTAAVEKALKRKKAPGPETRQGIVGLVKQVTRQEVARAVKGELKTREFNAGMADEVREAVTVHDSSDALATQHGQSHPFWHLLRTR